MGARQKLNQAYIVGSLFAATAVGYLFGSWTTFFVVTTVLIILSLLGGNVRPHARRR